MEDSDFESFIGFLQNYGYITLELSRLLEMTFISEEDFSKPIGKALKKIFYYHNVGQRYLRDCEIARLKMLVRDLQVLETHAPKLLEKFRMKINKNESNYYGFRFEVAVASHLLKKNIKFTMPDPPDFCIIYNSGKICVECTTRHIKPEKSFKVIQEVNRAINKKSRSRYSSPKCALFIDVTNIFFLAHIKNNLREIKRLKYAVKHGDIMKHQFGSILLFISMINRDKNRFERNYLRFDNTIIDKSLKAFLNECYPRGRHLVNEYMPVQQS